MTTACCIPARSDSRRVPGKNLQPVEGRSLLEWSVGTALSVDGFDHVIVDSDSEEVLALLDPLAGDPRLVRVRRPPELCDPFRPTPDVIRHMLRHVPPVRFVCVLHCTSPFLRPDTIEDALETLERSLDRHDSLFSVREIRSYLYRDGPLNFSPSCREATDGLEPYHELTGGLFVAPIELFESTGAFIGERPLPFPVSHVESLDVNTPDDLEFARLVARGLGGRR